VEKDNRIYIAIDLKSFFASVECAERGLDPLTTNLVVADASRTEKTICLAVSPSLKEYKIPGRARLFEVVSRVKEVNGERKRHAPNGEFTGKSWDKNELATHPEYELDYIIAPPRMAKYMKYSTDIYNIYLKYIAPEDMHVYSIDEVFMDVTDYLKIYQMTPRQLARTIIDDVLENTQITATAGIGTNMYLCKIAMDIVAKHIAPDKDGVRIAGLDEPSYRRLLWGHRPLTDFWRVGRGYARKLESLGLYTMGDIARCSLGSEDDFYNEELLYSQFGKNTELLIDHAWGYEPCTIADIKAYKPERHSVGSGQVLSEPYTYDRALLIVKEMTDLLALDLVDKGFVTNQIVMTVGYDIENLKGSKGERYIGNVEADAYGRKVPKSAHGTENISEYTSATSRLMKAATELYARIVNPDLLVRRIYLTANNILTEQEAREKNQFRQMSLFEDFDLDSGRQKDHRQQEKEKNIQSAVNEIKKKYGKNALLKGMNFKEGGTTIERNGQIGGHKA
jgi:DNA polymerase V